MDITYIREPTDLQCGQAVLAMVLGRTVEEIIAFLGNDRETDLREIVAYAKERHVTVVPEIEMPGHACGALAAYPNLACFPERIGKAAASDWGIFRDVFCIARYSISAR